MKKIAFFLILILAVGGLLFWLLENSGGSVLISTEDFVVQSSLWTALLLVVLLLAIVRTIYGLSRLVLAPGWRLLTSYRQRQMAKIREKNNEGLLAMAEGRWGIAESYLLQTVNEVDADTALVSYVVAAEAAAKKGDLAAAFSTLDNADKSGLFAGPAIGITRARLYLDQNRAAEAIAQLEPLHRQNHSHPYILYLLAQAYRTEGRWEELEQLLPDLEKYEVFNKNALIAGQIEIGAAQLAMLSSSTQAKTEVLSQLDQLWSHLKKPVRAEPKVLTQYVKALVGAGEVNTAEAILRRAINKKYDAGLILLYGELKSNDPIKKLAIAERWLSGQPENPDLLLTLGRLCKASGLWGKARDYLATSLEIENRPETCVELAEVMTQRGDAQQSRKYYRQGLLACLDRASEAPVG